MPFCQASPLLCEFQQDANVDEKQCPIAGAFHHPTLSGDGSGTILLLQGALGLKFCRSRPWLEGAGTPVTVGCQSEGPNRARKTTLTCLVFEKEKDALASLARGTT